MSVPVNILLVEDSVDDAELIIRELSRAGFEPTWRRVENEPDFLRGIQPPPDLVISDYSMPQFSGLAAARLLRQHHPEVPFILVSGTVGEDAAVEAMKHGATDYLLKDRIARLGKAVQRALEQNRLREERRQLQQQLLLQATALKTAANGIAITDATGKILWVNPAMVAATGYASAELVGQNFRLLKSGRHDDAYYREFWQTLRAGRTWRGEFINRRKDGALYYDEHTVTPVCDPQGQITHFVAITREITEEKLAREKARAKQELKIRHQAALLKLAAQETKPFRETLKDVLATDAQALAVNRVGFWRLHPAAGMLRAEALYSRETGEIQAGPELLRTDYPAYFKALEENPLIVANDAQTDPRTAEFTASYLEPLGITAMLDVPVWVRGVLVGVICHEHSEDARTWTDHEQDFALSIGNLISLALVEEERRLAEADLRKAQQKLAHVVSASPAITYLQSVRNSHYLPAWVSQNVEALTGFLPPEALHEQWWWNQLHPEDRNRVLAEMDQLERKKRITQEYRFQHRDGSYLWLRDEKRLLCDSSGRSVEVVGTWSDITERKQAEETQAELSHLNESFVRALGEVVYDHDVLGNRIVWGGNTQKCIGWSLAELGHDGTSWQSRIHPDDQAKVRAQLETLSIEPLFSSEYRFQHKAGHYVWVFDRGVMSRDAQGRITRIVGIMWDVTGRKRAEVALQEKEERFRQLAENIQEVFWMTDRSKNEMIYISPGYEKIWGRSCEALYRSPRLWLEAIHPDDRARVQSMMEAKQTAGTYDEEYRIVRPDGTVRWVRDRAFPVRDMHGDVYRIVGIAEDMTRQRELESQIRQVQKLEAVGQLAGGVAHDFNNLLTVIRGSSELLLTGNAVKTDDARELLQQIIVTSDRAANLTRQLLVFSRKHVMQHQLVDLNNLIEDLTKMLRRIVGEDIRFRYEFAENLPLVEADAGMLEQVLMNLVVNARDAMPQGGQLTIRTSVETRHGLFQDIGLPRDISSQVCLSVSDTGTGIPPEILPRIFEPFFTTKEAGKGTGLGLATVYGIVQQHRGWVDVQSEPGQGSTFQIGIPASSATATQQMEKAPRRSEPEPAPGTETILLVEDEPAVRSLVCTVLKRHGYRVLEAESGKAALGVWREHHAHINLLFTDMVMPDGISGPALAEELHQERPELKVIFSSGYSPESITRDLTLTSSSRYLQKPYNPQALLQTVRDCLDN